MTVASSVVKSRILAVLSAVAGLGFLVLNILTLYDGHNWGGDFSQYIIHAGNILDGRPYASGIMLDLPVVYPPGFPYLIAPVIQVFGVNFLALKSVNILFWYAALPFAWRLLKDRAGMGIVVLFCVLWAGSFDFFIFKQNVLSDVPFMYFTLAACWALERWRQKYERGVFAAFLILMAIAFFMRTAGAVFLAAAILYLVFTKKNREAVVAAGTLAACYLLQLIWTGGHPGFFTQAFNPHVISVASIISHAHVPIRSFLLFFFPLTAFFPSGLPVAVEWVIRLAAYIFYADLLWLLVRELRLGKPSGLTIFTVLYLAVLIVWSGTPVSENGFSRFVLPLIVPLVLVTYEKKLSLLKDVFHMRRAQEIVGAVTIVLLAVAVVANAAAISRSRSFNDDVLRRPMNVELFRWVGQHVRPTEHYLFWEPRVMALMTGRIGTAPAINPYDPVVNLPERIKRLQITYIIAIKGLDASMISALETGPAFYRLVWENSDYKVFQVLY